MGGGQEGGGTANVARYRPGGLACAAGAGALPIGGRGGATAGTARLRRPLVPRLRTAKYSLSVLIPSRTTSPEAVTRRRGDHRASVVSRWRIAKPCRPGSSPASILRCAEGVTAPVRIT